MIRSLALGILSAVFAYFVAVTVVNAQTATPSPTTSPSPTTTQTPGAPSTGFGQ